MHSEKIGQRPIISELSQIYATNVTSSHWLYIFKQMQPMKLQTAGTANVLQRARQKSLIKNLYPIAKSKLLEYQQQ